MTDAKINDIANLFERVWAVKNSQEFEEFMNRFSDKSEAVGSHGTNASKMRKLSEVTLSS